MKSGKRWTSSDWLLSSITWNLNELFKHLLAAPRGGQCLVSAAWVMRIHNRAKSHPLLSTVGTPAFISAGLHFHRGFQWYFSTSCSHIRTELGLIAFWIQWDVVTPDTSIIYILSLQTSSSLLNILRAHLPPKPTTRRPHHVCPCSLTYQLKHCIKLSLEVNQVLFRDSVQMLLVASNESSLTTELPKSAAGFLNWPNQRLWAEWCLCLICHVVVVVFFLFMVTFPRSTSWKAWV